jgi:hypothetical protein
MNASPP